MTRRGEVTAYTLSRKMRTAEEVRRARFDLGAFDEMEEALGDSRRYAAYLRTVDWRAVGLMITECVNYGREGRVDARIEMRYRRRA